MVFDECSTSIVLFNKASMGMGMGDGERGWGGGFIIARLFAYLVQVWVDQTIMVCKNMLVPIRYDVDFLL